MAMEIEIHRNLNHIHVVGFHSFFEDNDFIYILLEICRRRVSVISDTPTGSQFKLDYSNKIHDINQLYNYCKSIVKY